ncbi:MAG: hypothetical protein GX793_00910 [Bacteroidales bacterium]|jgi:O-antigen/teichoic acid export membrane protein|nr:hypothetical protein [Bacteroidales bacterium]MDY0313938.1 hypothetical protein [Bacteroidales bacterium]NLB85600.1 hypothetical protein [Bacteroidales bacterium]
MNKFRNFVLKTRARFVITSVLVCFVIVLLVMPTINFIFGEPWLVTKNVLLTSIIGSLIFGLFAALFGYKKKTDKD